MAWNKSACSVLVGKPVLGPPRCTLMMISGSSSITARPIASPLSAMPGPLVVVTAMAPPKDCADRGTYGGDFVFGLERADAEFLELAQFVQDVAGRRDRVAAEEQFLAAQFRGRHQSPGQRLVAHDVAVRARRQLGRRRRGNCWRRLRSSRRSSSRLAGPARWPGRCRACCRTSRG